MPTFQGSERVPFIRFGIRLLALLILMVGTVRAGTGLIQWGETVDALDRAQLLRLIDERFEAPMQQLLRTELAFPEPIVIEVIEQSFGFYDKEQQRIFIPLPNLYRVYEDLKIKYPQQSEVQHSILVSTMQFYFLSELVKALVIHYELRMSGWEAERVDAITALQLLRSDVIEQSYLLDAVEEFLLIDRSAGTVQADRFRNEFEADEYRLNQVFCIIEAYDSDGRVLSEWGGRQCGNQYESARSFWSAILNEHWTESSSFRRP